MLNIELIEYGSNEHMMDIQLDHVPRKGDYIILNDSITGNWKKQIYLVCAVTHLLNNDVKLHIEKHDVDAPKTTFKSLIKEREVK